MPPAKKPPPDDWSDSDRQHLRELADERAHRKWLADILKRWAMWVAAVAIGVRFVWDGLIQLIHQLGKGSQ